MCLECRAFLGNLRLESAVADQDRHVAADDQIAVFAREPGQVTDVDRRRDEQCVDAGGLEAAQQPLAASGETIVRHGITGQ